MKHGLERTSGFVKQRIENKVRNVRQPLVSVITPTYNAGKFIGETIESVINQTYQNWEMLVIDDGSTDNTRLVVESYFSKDRRIKLFPLGYNSGRPAVPRNYGIKHAQGKYIAFLDSDDLWVSKKLSKQVEYLQGHPNIALVYGLSKIFGNPLYDGVLLNSPNGKYSGNIFKELFIMNNIPCLTVMIRFSCLHQVGLFDERPDFKCVEDRDLWLRVSYNHKIGLIPEVLGLYRMHQSSSRTGEQYLRRLKVIEKYEQKKLVKPKLAARARSHIYFSAAMLDFHSQNKNSRQHFLQTLKNSPNFLLGLKAWGGLCILSLPTVIQKSITRLYYRFGKKRKGL